MQFLPVFLDLAGHRALVVGDGPTARRKAALLAAAGAVVVAWPAFSADDLPGCRIAVGADAAEAELRALSAAAQAACVPVNVVDRPELCSFIMPAIIDRYLVVVAVSTGGAAPVLARLLRARLEAALPPGIGLLAAVVGSVARSCAGACRRPPRGAACWNGPSGAVAELAFAGRETEARTALLDAANRGAGRRNCPFHRRTGGSRPADPARPAPAGRGGYHPA